MKIGILSDTHGFFHPALREVVAGVDYIVHAGDIGLLPVLRQLEAIAPVVAVRGNIDGARKCRMLDNATGIPELKEDDA